MARKKLGESLRERGRISHQDLEMAILDQAAEAVLLGELLLKHGMVSREDLISSLVQVTRTPYVEANSAAVNPDVLDLIPAKVAKRYCALPLHRQGSRPVVVMARPQDLQALQELAFVSGLAVLARFGFREEIEEAIAKHYEGREQEPAEVDDVLEEPAEEEVPHVEFVTATSTQRSLDAIREFQAELKKQTTPAVRLVSTIIAEANAKRASDIHIDPQARGPVVRIRVDGILGDRAAAGTQAVRLPR